MRNKLIVFLIGFLVIVSICPSVSAAGITSTVATSVTTSTTSTTPSEINNVTCQNCQRFTTALNPVITSPPKGSDLGRLNLNFQPNGQFTMQNQYGHSLTIAPVPATLPVSSAYQNSSGVTYSTGSDWMHFITQGNGYQENITITGSTAVPQTIALRLSCSQGFFNYSKFSVRCGYEIFQWDALNSASFDNSSNMITWTVSGIFNIDPIAIDGSAQGACASPCTSISTVLSTGTSPDVVIVYFGGNCGGANPTANTVSDTFGLTWTKRIHLYVAGFAGWIDEWYAIAPSILNPDTITTTLQHPVPCGNANMAVNIFAVSGASTSNPFDPNAGLPYHQTSSGGSAGFFVDTVTGVSTSNANDMLISGDFNGNGAGAFGGAGGFTLIASTSTTGGGETSSEYKVVSTTQSGITVTYSGADSDGFSYLMIVDALQQAANVTLTLIVDPSGSGTIYTNAGSSCHTTSTITCSIAISTAVAAFEIPIGLNGWQLWLNTSLDLVRCNIGQGFPTNPPSNDYSHCNFAAFSLFNNATLQANYTAGSGGTSHGSSPDLLMPILLGSMIVFVMMSNAQEVIRRK